MASTPTMINQIPNTYNSEFLKVSSINANPHYLNRDKQGINSVLYKVNGGHNKNVTKLNPQYDPRYILRNSQPGDGLQSFPMLIPCGKRGEVNKFNIQKYAEKNANLYQGSG